MTTIETQSRGWEEVPGLLQSVWRYKWMIAAAVLVGGLLGYGWASRQPTVYQAVSRVFVADPARSLPAGAAIQAAEPDRYLRNQAELVGSSEVLRRAAQLSGGRLSGGALAGRLNVDPSQDADVLLITMSDSSAEGAAELANAVAAAYERFAADQSRDTAEQLRSLRGRLETRLAEIQAQLAQRPNDGRLGREREVVSEKLLEIARQLLDAEDLAGTNRVLIRERAAVPEQPIQPAPRRSMAIGMLFGLVGSGALAWWLSGRQAARAAHMPATRGWKAQEGNGSIDLLTPQNGSVRRLDRLDEADRSAAPSASELAQDPNLAWSTLRDAVVRLDSALVNTPLEPYFEVLPQLMVDEITSRLSADLVVVLLDDGKESFEVAGGVGLRPEEHDMVVPQSHEALRQAVWDGLGIVPHSSWPGMEIADLPGGRTADALLMVPLVQRSTWLGMLLIGRRSGNGRPSTTFNDQEIRQSLQFAKEFAPVVEVLSVADELRNALRALGSVRDEREPRLP